jgi:hypothetical protein
MFIKLMILSVFFLAVAGIGFGISILLKPGGKFPETHVGRNREMRKRGIKCAQQTDIGCNPTSGFPGCSSCNPKGM